MTASVARRAILLIPSSPTMRYASFAFEAYPSPTSRAGRYPCAFLALLLQGRSKQRPHALRQRPPRGRWPAGARVLNQRPRVPSFDADHPEGAAVGVQHHASIGRENEEYGFNSRELG